MSVKLLKYVVNRGTDVRAEWGWGGWGTDAGRGQCTAVDGRCRGTGGPPRSRPPAPQPPPWMAAGVPPAGCDLRATGRGAVAIQTLSGIRVGGDARLN